MPRPLKWWKPGDSLKPYQAFRRPLTFLPSFSQDIPPTPQTALPIFLDLEDLVILQVAAAFRAYAAAGIEVTAAGGAMLILLLCHPGFLLSDRFSFLLLSAPGGAETALGSYLICGKAGGSGSGEGLPVRIVIVGCLYQTFLQGGVGYQALFSGADRKDGR